MMFSRSTVFRPAQTVFQCAVLDCSVLNRTPSDLIEEVILVDDCSDDGM
jgi:hypothetical protein